MNISKNDENRLESQNPDTGDNLNDERVKLFTQEQVNKIVEDRLKKEKSKSGALKELKAAVTDLYNKGYFEKYRKAFGKNISLATMVEILLSELGDLKNKSSSDSDKIQLTDAGKDGNESHDRSEIGKNKNENKAGEYNFPSIPVNSSGIMPEWSVNPHMLEMFAQNKNVPMEKILEEYVKFVMTLERQRNIGGSDNNKEQSLGNRNRNISESGYTSVASAQSARTNDNFTLTERQKELARAGGLTYREYHDYINNISSKKPRTL